MSHQDQRQCPDRLNTTLPVVVFLPGALVQYEVLPSCLFGSRMTKRSHCLQETAPLRTGTATAVSWASLRLARGTMPEGPDPPAQTRHPHRGRLCHEQQDLTA